MVGAEGFLQDRQGALEEGLRLSVAALGLTWTMTGGRKRTELIAWLGKRGAAGCLPPKGFPKSTKFD